MSVPQAQAIAEARPALRDLVALTKPRVTGLVLVTTAGGMYLGHGRLSAARAALAVAGTALVVGGANALNMYAERDTDALMARTRLRPVASGRVSPRLALGVGIALSAAAMPVLGAGVNVAVALLAALAHLLYVLAYTPLKRRSHHAILVGAVPGAIPPLLGWTATTGTIDAAGISLFAILYLWQVPHFLAIAIFRRDEYARAGLRVTPNVVGRDGAAHAIVHYAFALVGASLLPVPLGVAHRGYLVVACALGAAFFALACVGLRRGAGDRWARGVFFASMAYLVLLFAALVIDA